MSAPSGAWGGILLLLAGVWLLLQTLVADLPAYIVSLSKSSTPGSSSSAPSSSGSSSAAKPASAPRQVTQGGPA